MEQMKVAIMQPYFLPYIGYFQLINAVDTFVIYDDVNYIKKGWINRNQINVNGASVFFTIPLEKVSQNKLICNTFISNQENWREKLIKTIQNNYSKAPNFQDFFYILNEIINFQTDSISEYNLFSIRKICEYLKIHTNIISSSHIFENQYMKGEDRIIDICKKVGATNYINPAGGAHLYNEEFFLNNNIVLNFHHSTILPYNQFESEFIGGLSIIDVLMFKTSEEVSREMIKILDNELY